MNPIAKYLGSEKGKIIPVAVYEELLPLLHDEDIQEYFHTCIRHAIETTLPEGPGGTLELCQKLIICGMAAGYVYGKEGNKTSEEIASQLLKDLNIREGKDEHK